MAQQALLPDEGLERSRILTCPHPVSCWNGSWPIQLILHSLFTHLASPLNSKPPASSRPLRPLPAYSCPAHSRIICFYCSQGSGSSYVLSPYFQLLVPFCNSSPRASSFYSPVPTPGEARGFWATF